MHLLINKHKLFFGSRNTVALVATQCPYYPQYEEVLIYITTNSNGSKNRDNDDDSHDNNNFQLWLQTASQQLGMNSLDSGFKCPSQIQTEELQRVGDDTAAFLELHDLWTHAQQLRSLIPTCAWAMVCPWQKHPALAWGFQRLETFSTPPISAANCAQG